MPDSLPAPQIFLLIALSLLALFSSFILALQTRSFVFISQNAHSTLIVEGLTIPTPRILGYLPLHLYHAPSKLVIATSITCLIISTSGTTLVLYAWSRGVAVQTVLPLPLPRRHQIPLLTLLVPLPFFLSFATTITTYVARAKSAHFIPNLLSPDSAAGFRWYGNNGYYSQGIFALENWACEVASYLNTFGDDYTNSAEEDLSGVCSRERLVRIFMLVLAKVALGAVVMWIWTVKREGTKLKEKVNGESGFDIRMESIGGGDERGV